MEPLYRNLYRTEEDIEEIAEFLKGKIGDCVPEEIRNIEVDSFSSVRDRLILRLIGFEKNREKIQSLVYREYLDMAVVPCILFLHERVGRGITEVSRAMLESWQVSEDELFETAMKTTPLLLPATLRTLKEAAMITDADDTLGDLYVLSNEEAFLGASAILYSGKLAGLAEEVQADICILPTSIHETILVPEGRYDTAFLREALVSVNAADVPKEDILTDSVYCFRHSSGQISIL